MAPRHCIDCRALTTTTRCARCSGARQRARDARRGSTAQRGYNADHNAIRQRYAKLLKRQRVLACWRCGKPIHHGQRWHLGHDDVDRGVIRGLECVGCNCATNTRGRATAH